MQITDRSKDVINSGGGWIGSIDLENMQWLILGGLHRCQLSQMGMSARCSSL
jgi:hypothetical protein